jgi:hypothetical protein
VKYFFIVMSLRQGSGVGDQITLSVIGIPYADVIGISPVVEDT